jgi:hypothetical protein
MPKTYCFSISVSSVDSLLVDPSVTLQWETKSPQGHRPSGRGYHVAVLHDARIYVSGGYNGVDVFDDLWSLDLSAAAYLPQVVSGSNNPIQSPGLSDGSEEQRSEC